MVRENIGGMFQLFTEVASTAVHSESKDIPRTIIGAPASCLAALSSSRALVAGAFDPPSPASFAWVLKDM
jgi:hypothetical protein